MEEKRKLCSKKQQSKSNLIAQIRDQMSVRKTKPLLWFYVDSNFKKQMSQNYARSIHLQDRENKTLE